MHRLCVTLITGQNMVISPGSYLAIVRGAADWIGETETAIFFGR